MYPAEVTRALGRIEGKLDVLTVQMGTMVAEHAGLEKRVRGLENWRMYAVGLFSLGGLAVIAEIVRWFL